jgi:hypothetical protein
MGAAAKQNQQLHTDALWFVARGATLMGPFSTEQLEGRVKSRELSFLDYCWRQGFREWRPIGSIDDFDRRGRLRSLPDYPNVEVPAGPTPLKLQLVDSKQNATPNRKSFEITLARGRRHSITIYEWGAAAIFSIVLAYFAAVFSVQNFASEVDQKILLSFEAGAFEAVGQTNADAVSTDFVGPLLSAPGLLGGPAIAARGPLNRGPASFVSASVEVSGLTRGREWHLAHPEFDPVYRRNLQVNGELKVTPAGGASFVVHELGEPYLNK